MAEYQAMTATAYPWCPDCIAYHPADSECIPATPLVDLAYQELFSLQTFGSSYVVLDKASGQPLRCLSPADAERWMNP